MHKVTLAARFALAAATVVTLAAIPSSAEARARGFRLRFGVGSAAARTPALPSRPPERMAAAGLPMLIAPLGLGRPAAAAQIQPDLRASDAGDAASMTASIPVKPPSLDAAKPAPAVRVAGPWCATDRIVGTGAGFCQVN